MISQSEIIEIVYAALPYSEQIRELDLTCEDAIRFKWRGITYRVSDSLMVEEAQGGILFGTDGALLMEALIKRFWAERKAAI